MAPQFLHFPVTVAVAQLDPTVGDIAGNMQKALAAISQARKNHVQLLVFPELFLMGYPPYDLIFEKDCLPKLEKAVQEVACATSCLDVVIGTPFGSPDSEGRVFNMAVHMSDGHIVGTYRKQCLPFYDVFFEPRYFRKGNTPYVFDLKGVKIQILICEDVWSLSEPWGSLYEQTPFTTLQKADMLFVLSASPWHMGKGLIRESVMSQAARRLNMPIIAANQVGGQDDLLFDGRSFALSALGEVIWRAPSWKEDVFVVQPDQVASTKETFVDALTFGIAEYVRKTGNHDIVVGLSGGIDSAVVISLAVRALGKEHVHAFFLPSRFTSQESEKGAQSVAHLLGVPLITISIEPLFQEALKTLDLSCDGSKGNLVAENLQARLRALILMAQANKSGNLLLCCSNKSELSLGYSTLYGDLAGALAPIGDLLKEEVYVLGRELDLPESLFTKPPSPELCVGQTDEDEMPFPFATLDPLLEQLVIQHAAAPTDLRSLVFSKEFKRKQAPLILRVSQKAFGSGRLFPVAGTSYQSLSRVFT